MDGTGAFTSANEIEAAYQQFKAEGRTYITQLGGAPMWLSEWRDRELKRLADRQRCTECG
jgi:hypothetical protein